MACAFVLVDFAFDIRPPAVHSSYQFTIGELDYDHPKILRQDNLHIVVIKRSPATSRLLTRQIENTQDPESKQSRQPEYATNRLRSRHPDYFVSYAIGTDLGCGLVVESTTLREICSTASYDFAGRAIKALNKFPNLTIPDYNFSNSFNTLTIRP